MHIQCALSFEKSRHLRASGTEISHPHHDDTLLRHAVAFESPTWFHHHIAQLLTLHEGDTLCGGSCFRLLHGIGIESLYLAHALFGHLSERDVHILLVHLYLIHL